MQKVIMNILCSSKEETANRVGDDYNEWIIKMGDEEMGISFRTMNKAVADLMTPGKEYKVIIKERNPDELTTKYLISVHPELNKVQAALLLKFSKENTIDLKSCYGDGSIIYPKWKESICQPNL